MDLRRYRIWLTLMAAGALAGGHTLFALTGADSEQLGALVPLRCPLHLLTGLACPTCGLGRSLVLAAGGEWSASWSHHPLGSLLIAATPLFVATLWLAPTRLAALLDRTRRAAAAHPGWIWSTLLVYSLWGFTRHF